MQVVLIDPGLYRTVEEAVKEQTKGKGAVEILDMVRGWRHCSRLCCWWTGVDAQKVTDFGEQKLDSLEDTTEGAAVSVCRFPRRCSLLGDEDKAVRASASEPSTAGTTDEKKHTPSTDERKAATESEQGSDGGQKQEHAPSARHKGKKKKGKAQQTSAAGSGSEARLPKTQKARRRRKDSDDDEEALASLALED